MSNNTIDAGELAKAHVPSAAMQGTTFETKAGRGSIDVGKTQTLSSVRSPESEELDDTPSEEDLRTLRRVSGKINWAAYTIAFAELAERFSYYGSSVLYTNFVQWPLPDGSRTGAGGLHGQPGALGMGQKAAQGISLFNQFFAYFMPLVGYVFGFQDLGTSTDNSTEATLPMPIWVDTRPSTLLLRLVSWLTLSWWQLLLPRSSFTRLDLPLHSSSAY